MDKLLSERVIVKIPKYNIPVKHVEPVMIPIDKMLPHEEIVSKRLEDLIDLIKSLNAVDLPLIIAPIPGTDKYLIVDGHHRWAALKALGAKKAPAIIVDYFDPSIKLHTWYPAFTGDLELFLEELRKASLEYSVCVKEEAIERIDRSGYAFILIGRNNTCILIHGGIEEQKKVSHILDKLSSKGLIKLVYYGLKDDALKDLESKDIEYVLLRKPPSKEEVIEVVKKGEVFSPKTTRHVLPYIPAKTYTPLSMCF